MADGNHAEAAARIARDAFGIDVQTVRPLHGDAERNFRVDAEEGARYLLRVHVSDAPLERIEFERALLAHAVERDPELRGALQSAAGGARPGEVEFDGAPVPVTLLEWLPGRPMIELERVPEQLLHEAGALLGRIDRALAFFPERAAPTPTRSSPGVSWDLAHAPEVVARHVDAIESEAQRALVERVLARGGPAVAAATERSPSQVIHQDANDSNLLVRAINGHACDVRVTGLIDFGDATWAPRVFDPAIGAAYAALRRRDPLGGIARFVAGFQGECALTKDELALVFDLARLRLAASVTIAAVRVREGTASASQLVTHAPAWRALELLDRVDPNFAALRIRAAAGVRAQPGPDLDELMRGLEPADVLGAPLTGAPFVDLSIDSAFLAELSGAGEPDLAVWGAAVEELRVRSGATAVLGHHDETRALYATEAFSTPRDDFDEPRTVHIGVDLFAPAGTAVHAPLEGTVVSVQRNGAHLDYGPTLILRHEVEAGARVETFHTLYGHLALGVLDALAPGDRVARGARIAELGDASVNGGWPPHLHFQVVRDLFGHVGDFPGVCGPSERAAWTANSPDPAPLLGLEDCGAHEPSLEDVHARRREAFCSSMSISYDVPLHIVKGRGTTLFDAGGRPFLDAVNNVAHVGHCHPRVVAAAQRQTALLGTNTRYLSESRLAYVDALRARLPEHLEVVYLVSSGSEANELALRLARAATGRRDVLVQEHGYHGHSSALVELSHYKFARKGGFERRAWVDVVPIADPYRGAHRGPDSGPDYAREVEARLVQMEAEGRPAAALFAEAIVGCGGQVVPPDGYLAAAFEAARSAGAVAVADEVQVGFGRVGTHFWAFEEQGAVPDIVTMGKPMGNGHPIAGVATTRAIADAFAGGMEFFATFGGNDVSCAIGHAVLDVIEDEGLVANAAARGAQFFEALSPLAKELELIGDVRGRGLYLGVDLVADAETLAPDGAAAHWTANRMRELGILISTDGPAENVLKIKPPIVFSEAEMERLVCTLGGVLREAQSLRVQIRCQDHQQR